MNLQQLLEEAPPAAQVRGAVERLIAEKSHTRELGRGSVPAVIRDFVGEEFAAAAAAAIKLRSRTNLPQLRATAAEAFGEMVQRWAP